MDVRLNWTDPTTRADGAELAADALDYISVSMSADAGASFTEVMRVAPGTQEFVQTDLPFGTFTFRLVAVDKQRVPQSSDPVDVEATLEEPLLAAPSPVLDVTVTIG